MAKAARASTKRPLTAAQAAAVEFEPWVHQPDEWKPPSNTEWSRLANPHLVATRLAWLTLYKTKPELVQVLTEMGDDAEPMVEGIVEAIDLFKGFVTVLECSLARICSAAAIVDGHGPQKKGPHH